jgi:hypothetical protein
MNHAETMHTEFSLAGVASALIALAAPVFS